MLSFHFFVFFRSPAAAKFLRCSLLATSVWLLFAAGCASTDQGGASPDLAVCDGYVCTGGCDSTKDCRAGYQCDPVAHLCYQCESDSDCPGGEVCGPNHTCAMGCNARHGCGSDGGVCEADAGVCVGCLSDGDCTDPTNSRCDQMHSTCVPCLPTSDNCGYGTYCQSLNAGGYACSMGCKTDNDCLPQIKSSDGGTSSDGGGNSGDGGGGVAGNDGGLSDGGGGGSPGSDGGAGGNGLNYCDQTVHACVRCLVDSECPIGKVCKADACVDGCTDMHGCPNNLSCCNSLCVDPGHDVQNCGGCNIACGGGENCCGASCSNPVNDTQNCGGCGIACAIMNGVPACTNRACTVAACNPGWADCNGLLMDGCEVNTNSSVTNCGGCGNACAFDHAQANCTKGMCGIASCSYPFFDCNMKAADGCEVNSATDASNCGACGHACDGTNGNASCINSNCQISCLAGYGNCNGNASDGCEVTFATDAKNCGSCGSVCSLPNATPKCGGGLCQVGTCNAGWADCNGIATDGCEVNLNNDIGHCGSCATVCSTNNAAPTCVLGACKLSCSAGYADCNKDVTDGCEISLNIDAANCSACGSVCKLANASQVCANGNCKVGSCNAGFLDCNGLPGDGCEISSTSDALNCSGCGKACPSTNGTASCVASVCQIACNPGYADCNKNAVDGCEINVNSDVNNCSACGMVCSLPNASAGCSGGSCVIASCSGGFADCDGKAANGCEAHTTIDVMNCGGCGGVCSTNNGTPGCFNSTCSIACNAGYGNCNGSVIDGCESSFDSDVKNCGGCGTVCNLANATAGCSAGSCTIASCNAGYADCNGSAADGCEVNLNSDANHCGICTTTCSSNNGTASCSSGVCKIACAAGYADCNMLVTDGCEANLNSDVKNCNACGAACNLANASPSCSGGNCKIASCNSTYLDCNGLPGDGCEINGATDASNCSGCGKACPSTNGAASCVASACQIACNAGFADCNKSTADGCEVNLNADPNNCSTCGEICSPNNVANRSCGLVAGMGTCNGTCANGFADCDNNKQTNGCETPVSADISNCGGCGLACSLANATPNCVGGSCGIANCSPNFADCDGSAADGCEVNTQTTPAHCGGCLTACSGANMNVDTCTMGNCTGSCQAGYLDCDNNLRNDGCEVNGQIDASNCGGCSITCSNNNMASRTCGGGVCNGTCAASFADCDNNKQTDGCEVSTNSVTNCGPGGAVNGGRGLAAGCGAVCSTQNGVPACATGSCTIACNAGYANCNNIVGNTGVNSDGCEVNTANDPNNCGVGGGSNSTAPGCGVVCSNSHVVATSCAGGVCNSTCLAGFADCDSNKHSDGCEASTYSVTNCGPGGATNNGQGVAAGCGAVCSTQNGTPGCGAGSCTISCNAGYGNCDGIVGNTGVGSNGCEANTSNSDGQVNGAINHCGVCGATCPFTANASGTSCSGSACNVTSCNAGFANCNLAYFDGCEVNTTSDNNNCGGCGIACGGGLSCINSVCTGTKVLIGNFNVINGQNWGGNPPTYTCQQACALLFGGAAAQYACSINAGNITHTAYETEWGVGGCQVEPEAFAQPLNGNYNCGGAGCSFSAYTQDNCTAVNYCFR